jgi:hypothetical protein
MILFAFASPLVNEINELTIPIIEMVSQALCRGAFFE